MRTYSSGIFLWAVIFMLFPGPLVVHSSPFIWESDFGAALSGFTDTFGDPEVDDGQTGAIPLSFGFSFAGITHTEIFVGTNGGLQLGGLGNDDEIDYDLWSDFQAFISDGKPMLCPFCSDLDLTSRGTIHFKDFGDRAVVTWNEVGSDLNENAPFTFQTQLLNNGQIIMAWSSIPNDLQGDLGEGIVIGIAAGDDPDPGTRHFLADLPFSGGTSIYEIWCFRDVSGCGNIDGDQKNPVSGFPLDGEAVIFSPLNVGTYRVTLAAAPPSSPVPEPEKAFLFLAGLALLWACSSHSRGRHEKPSPTAIS